MPRQKLKQKLMKRRISSISRVIACASFLLLTIVGISSLVRAMSLEDIAHENGIPSSWEVASLGNPDNITIPITYWDQRQDDCSAANRQFEWTECRLYAKGIVPNIVQDQLGSDGLPVPTYSNNVDAWNAYHDVFTANVTGRNPVQPGDNFYRWFHEATDENGKQLSKRFDREVTFRRSGNNSYEYGSRGTFPLDDVDFSKSDSASSTGHNFHFTAHMRIPMKISADGTEQFWFSGDDDVWVFLNGKLVLDLGGLHADTAGNFKIDQNGNIVSTVSNVNSNQACRQTVASPLTVGYDIYNSQLENKCARTTVNNTIPANFQPGDVVNLDFFYAERSTSESNTRINISNMNWPISADSKLSSTIVGKIGDTESKLVQNIASITNRDPENPLNIERIAAYVHESVTDNHLDGNIENKTLDGFAPLNLDTLYYTTDPNDPSSWQSVEISAPSNSSSGFVLSAPLTLATSGSNGDTLYFRYFTETSELSGNLSGQINFYTALNGISGVTYDYDKVEYTGKPTLDTPTEPEIYTVTINYIDEEGNEITSPYVEKFDSGADYAVDSPQIEGYTPSDTTISGTVAHEDVNHTVVYTKNPDPITPPVDPTDPVNPNPQPEPSNPNPTPSVPNQPQPTPNPNRHLYPSNIIGDASSLFLNPLGEIAYVPNTGVITQANIEVFEQYFADVILSQSFIMIILLIFAGSFATYFSLRKYLHTKTNYATAKRSARAATSEKAKINKRRNTSPKTTGRKKSNLNSKTTTNRKSSTQTKSKRNR